MEVCWYFYRFDYARYLAIRPALRSATTPSAFAALAEGPETETAVDALLEEDITLVEARNIFVQSLCFVGDPLQMDKGLARFVANLARQPGAEDAGEMLGELMAGGKNVEAWLQPTNGLVGFLSAEETQALRDAWNQIDARGKRRKRKGRRRRRGGLVGAVAGFFSNLFDRAPRDEDRLDLLRDFLDEAVQNGEGIAAVAA